MFFFLKKEWKAINTIILNTQPNSNPNSITMTKMFSPKPLLDMGLQKSLDLVKNGFLIHHTTA